jgi:transcriptional regulator with XRE-family HTH domain
MSDWERLGTYVVARRVELGHKQRAEFAAALQVSVRLLSDIENGRRSNYDPVTIAALENVLGWETGSAQRIADGGEPELRQQPATAPGRTHIAGPAQDEIDLIYASKTMSAKQKLEAIRMVLELRKQAEEEAPPAGETSSNAPVERANNNS